MSSVFFPIFSFLLQLVVAAWWVVVFMFLASSMDKKFTMKSLDSTVNCSVVEEDCTVDDPIIPGCVCTFTALSEYFKKMSDHYQPIVAARNPTANYLQIYNVFMLFWGMCFVSALGEMVLAGAFSSW